MKPPKIMQPGDNGASRRCFGTEEALAEATTCPAAGTPGQAWRLGDTVSLPTDGTSCHGPRCPMWHTILSRDEQGVPVRAEVVCMLGKRANGMGIIKRPEPARRPRPIYRGEIPDAEPEGDRP